MFETKILIEYKEALKGGDKIKSSTLSLLRSNLANLTIKLQKKALEDKDVIGEIKRIVKQHNDSIEQFKKGSREDLVEKETKELEVLRGYLPAELPKEEIVKIIEEVIKELAAKGPKDMGRVMKGVMEKVASQADGKLVSDLVRQKLTERTLKA